MNEPTDDVASTAAPGETSPPVGAGASGGPADLPSATSRRLALGIDVGGTGVKAAVVDVATGMLVSDRTREKTPQPSTPEAVLGAVRAVVARLEAAGHATAELPAGAGLPSVIKAGRVMTAANIDQAWVGAPARELMKRSLGRPVLVLNDADAAGLAEMRFGAGAGEQGIVLMLTVGTGIGSALFVGGQLVPNLELGHLQFRNRDAETIVSAAARERRRSGWKRWARDFNSYLAMLERYFWPDLIIVGGGLSKEAGRYLPLLRTRCRLSVARYLNIAGIIGAALAAAEGVAQP